MHDDDNGHGSLLALDLETMLERRRILRWMAALGLGSVVGCGSDGAANDNGTSAKSTAGSGAVGRGQAGSSAAGSAASADAACASIPEETEGPYPGDGTNGANALQLSGILRSDITSSLGSASGKAAGVPLTVKLKLVDSKGSCAALAGHAVYLWHCDRDGNYSMYTGSATAENYLRGVQETDSDGTVTFVSIFPACYSGRWPHIHFEIYETLAKATTGSNKLATSQLALPEAQCKEVFATAGYSASIANLAKVSLGTDMVFSDGATLETPIVTGSVNSGYTATLTVAI